MTLLGSGGNENDEVSDDDESNAIEKSTTRASVRSHWEVVFFDIPAGRHARTAASNPLSSM